MRTARARASLGILALLVLFGAVIAVVALRARHDSDLRAAMSQRALTVATIEDARDRVAREVIAATTALSTGDPASIDAYRQTQANTDDALNVAQTSLIDTNDLDAANSLNVLSIALGYVRQDTGAALGSAVDENGATMAVSQAGLTETRLDYILDALDGLTGSQQVQLASQRLGVDRSSDATLVLVVTSIALAFLAAAAVAALAITSVTRPLAVLRSRVRAITMASARGTAAKGMRGPEEVVALAQDVDRIVEQRRSLQATLSATEEKYRALFEGSIDGVYIRDLEGRFIDANDVALEMLGCTRAELLSALGHRLL